jgi:hypothetical protein
MKKAFDWELCSKLHRPDWVAWLAANHAREVTEAEFIEAYRVGRTADSRPHKSRRYSSAKLRHSYRNLREDFAFFSDPESPAPGGTVAGSVASV